MSDKAAAIDALVYDWHRSERSDDCCVQPLSRLRSSFRSGSADNVSTGADICNASNRAGEPETWSNSTIFAIVAGAAIVGLMMWTALGYAVFQTFVHWT